MNSKKLFLGLGLAVLGLFSSPDAASALKVKALPGYTDQQFEDLIAQGKFDEDFVAELRIGNNATNQNPLTGESELSLFNVIDNPRSLPPIGSRQFDFTSGQAVDFFLEFTGSLFKFNLGGTQISSTPFSGPFTDIFLRTRAGNRSSSILLSSLKLNDISIGSLDSNSFSGETDIDYIRISDLPNTNAFKLTGQVTMNYSVPGPARAQLAAQIKVGKSPIQVPEPGTMGALLLTGLAAVGYSKRKKQANQSIG